MAKFTAKTRSIAPIVFLFLCFLLWLCSGIILDESQRLGSACSESSVRFVDKETGDDSNCGTALEPFKTIDQAVSTMSGDLVLPNPDIQLVIKKEHPNNAYDIPKPWPFESPNISIPENDFQAGYPPIPHSEQISDVIRGQLVPVDGMWHRDDFLVYQYLYGSQSMSYTVTDEQLTRINEKRKEGRRQIAVWLDIETYNRLKSHVDRENTSLTQYLNTILSEQLP
jgi:hypothetical protein